MPFAAEHDVVAGLPGRHRLEDARILPRSCGGCPGPARTCGSARSRRCRSGRRRRPRPSRRRCRRRPARARCATPAPRALQEVVAAVGIDGRDDVEDALVHELGDLVDAAVVLHQVPDRVERRPRRPGSRCRGRWPRCTSPACSSPDRCPGLLMVIRMMSRPPWLLPSDESFRNFGHAFSSFSKSAFSSAMSCQRLKSSRTLNCGSEPGLRGWRRCAAAPHATRRRWTASAGPARVASASVIDYGVGPRTCRVLRLLQRQRRRRGAALLGDCLQRHRATRACP